MKIGTRTLIVTLVGCLASAVSADDGKDAKWFDMEHCAMCKHMADHPDLVTKIKCETHVIDNGMLMVSDIPKEQQAAMEAVHKKMGETIAELMSGKELPLCGFCSGFGKLMEAGAKSQEIKTSMGTISLLTSDKPEVVKKIQEFAKQTQTEYEKMQQQMQAKAAK
jgi:hypothetical protein